MVKEGNVHVSGRDADSCKASFVIKEIKGIVEELEGTRGDVILCM